MKKRNRAFTIIEVLLALSIFSVIALSLYGTFASGLQLNRRSQGSDRIHREIKWALDILSRDLENAVFYDFSRSYPEKRSFTGTKEKISFLLAEDDALKMISYSLEALQFGQIHKVIRGGYSKRGDSIVTDYKETRESESFIREEKGFIDFLDSGEEGSGEKETLSPHVKPGSLRFSYGYFENGQENENINWRDSWEEEFPPDRVRMEVTFVSQDRTQKEISVEKETSLATRTLPAGGM